MLWEPPFSVTLETSTPCVLQNSHSASKHWTFLHTVTWSHTAGSSQLTPAPSEFSVWTSLTLRTSQCYTYKQLPSSMQSHSMVTLEPDLTFYVFLKHLQFKITWQLITQADLESAVIKSSLRRWNDNCVTIHSTMTEHRLHSICLSRL